MYLSYHILCICYKMLWKNLSISEMNQNSYLVIQNIGHVDIYEFFIMIKK